MSRLDKPDLQNHIRMKTKYYVLRKMILLNKEFEWFSKVDVFRQRGFYSDYQESLKSPTTITYADYLHAIERLERVRKIGKSIFEGFEIQDDNAIQSINDMRINFRQRNLYGHLGNELAKLRQSRDNPFDTIKKNYMGN
jgi:hypothetical protein